MDLILDSAKKMGFAKAAFSPDKEGVRSGFPGHPCNIQCIFISENIAITGDEVAETLLLEDFLRLFGLGNFLFWFFNDGRNRFRRGNDRRGGRLDNGLRRLGRIIFDIHREGCAV